MSHFSLKKISCVIGLGNPGTRYELTRHNIGFLFLDYLADQYGGRFSTKGNLEEASITVTINDEPHKLLLIKPMTTMNVSGKVVPYLQKQGIKPESTLIVYDELEKKFGTHQIRLGGSHRGHNGVRSFMNTWGDQFWRLRLGIDRPQEKNLVAEYVLGRFPKDQLDHFEELFSTVLSVIQAK